MCDLLGGTPFKEASKLTSTKSNIKVVSGCNVGSLLQIIPNKDKVDINELANQITNYSVKNIISFDEKSKFQESKGGTDGI
jgi:PTS system N-acetylgalactosamine-specific IIA component